MVVCVYMLALRQLGDSWATAPPHNPEKDERLTMDRWMDIRVMPLLFTTLKYYEQLYTRLPANQWNQLPLLSVLLHIYLILGHLQYSSTYFKDYSRCCLLILYCRIHLFNISSIRQKESKVRFKSAAGDLIPLQKWSLGRQAETPRLSCLESVTPPLPLFSL